MSPRHPFQGSEIWSLHCQERLLLPLIHRGIPRKMNFHICGTENNSSGGLIPASQAPTFQLIHGSSSYQSISSIRQHWTNVRSQSHATAAVPDICSRIRTSGRKRHPGFGLIGDVSSPLTGHAAFSGQRPWTELRREVPACKDEAVFKQLFEEHVSTSCPRYITQILSDIWRTTERSCVTNM